MPATLDNPVISEDFNFGKILLAQSDEPAPVADPTPEPEKEPVKEPEKEPVKEPGPVKEPVKEPAKEKLTTKEPVKEPAAPVVPDEPAANPHFRPLAEKPDGDQSEKAIKSWAEAKAENKRLAALLAEKETALKASTQDKAAQAENEALKAQLEEKNLQLVELEHALKAAKVEVSPEYKKQVVAPTEALRGSINEIATTNDADAGKIWAAITEPDAKKRKDLMEDITEGFRFSDRDEVFDFAREYHRTIVPAKERLESESSQISEAERARQAAAEQEFIERDRQLQNVFAKKTWLTIEERNEFLRPIEGEDAWNNTLAAAKRASVETNLDSLDVETRTRILSQAAAYPMVESAAAHYKTQLAEVVTAKDAKIAELQSQIDAMSAATPNLGTKSPSTGIEDGIEPDAKGSFNFGRNIIQR